MNGQGSHDRRFDGGADRLRSPGRLAMLEVPRVTELCVEGLIVRTALDIGTGTGIFAEAFADRGIAATGVDVNPGLLALARALVPSVAFVEAAAEKLPFGDDSFDLVFLAQVLHEVDDPSAALKEARRVAKGRVAILEWPYREGPGGPPLAHRLDPTRLSSLATGAGFAKVETMHLRSMDFFRLDA